MDSLNIKKIFWSPFPNEITLSIFSFLNINTLGKVALVSKQWKEGSEQNLVWRYWKKTLSKKVFTISPWRWPSNKENLKLEVSNRVARLREIVFNLNGYDGNPNHECRDIIGSLCFPEPSSVLMGLQLKKPSSSPDMNKKSVLENMTAEDLTQLSLLIKPAKRRKLDFDRFNI